MVRTVLFLVIVILSGACVRGFAAAHRNVIIASRIYRNRNKNKNRNRNRNPNIMTLNQKMEKCKYANYLFPLQKDVCSIKPQFTYRNIYDQHYMQELWEFHQNECLYNEKDPGRFIALILTVILVYFISQFIF